MEWTDGSTTPYDTLGLAKGLESSDEEIRKAFKTMALKKHPDKNKNNPRAAAEFGEVESAYRVLTDAAAKEALDNFIRAKLEREARHSMQSEKRRKLREDLDRKEKTVVFERREEDTAKTRLRAELDRLRRKVEEEQMTAAVRAKQAADAVAAATAANTPANAQLDEAMQAQLGRTLKVVWDATIRDYPPEELRRIFAVHGTVEDVVIRSSKKKRQVSALVVMASKDAAHAAVGCVNGDPAAPLLVMPLLKDQAAGLDPSSLGSQPPLPHNNNPAFPSSSSHQPDSTTSNQPPSHPSTSSRSFPIPAPQQSSAPSSNPSSSFPKSTSFPIPASTSFPIPTPGTSNSAGTQQPPASGSGFSSFPGAFGSFKPPSAAGGGMPGAGGGVEGTILEKMRRAAERERALAEAAREAEEEDKKGT